MLQLRPILSALFVLLVCEAGGGWTGLRHGWACADSPTGFCVARGPQGTQLVMPAGARGRFFVLPSPPGTHVSMRCRCPGDLAFCR